MLFAAAVAPEVSAAARRRGRPAPRTITFLTGNGDTDVASAKAVIEAFQAANPGITVKTRHPPGGSEGDNLVKTRLATGDMSEVFIYNNGSLLQAIKPEQNLAPLDDQPWAGQLDRAVRGVVQGRRRQALRRSVGDGVRWRGAVQHSALQEAGPGGPEDVG